MLTKKITYQFLQIKNKEILEQKIRDFNQEISDLDIKNKEISTKIDCCKDMLQYFENQNKLNKWWPLFSNLNQEITKIQIKIKDLNEELNNNAKNIVTKQIEKLSIFEEVTELQDDLYQSKNNQYQIIFNKLNIILATQEFKPENKFDLSLPKNSFIEEDKYDDRKVEINRNLKEQKKLFDDEIIFFEQEVNRITHQIQILEKDIIDLTKQKIAKNWQITCSNIITFGIFKYYRKKKFDKKIKEIEVKLKALTKEKVENEKNIKRLKKIKLNKLEEIKTLEDNMCIKFDVNNLEKINKILTTIIDKQVVEEFDQSNPFFNNEVIERQNSEDSGIIAETKQFNSTDSLKLFY